MLKVTQFDTCCVVCLYIIQTGGQSLSEEQAQRATSGGSGSRAQGNSV